MPYLKNNDKSIWPVISEIVDNIENFDLKKISQETNKTVFRCLKQYNIEQDVG